jgi:hypothetical protein
MPRIIVMLAAGAWLSAAGVAQAKGLELFVEPVAYFGPAAQVAVEAINDSEGYEAGDVVCTFMSLGRPLGEGFRPLGMLAPGERMRGIVAADVGGRTVDSVVCRVLPVG